MRARFSDLELAALILAVTLSPPALADPPDIAYRLVEGASYQEGCFGSCMCPILIADLEGTFRLGHPETFSDGVTIWGVWDVDWTVPGLGYRVSGDGAFILRTGPDGQLQQLVLNLSINEGPRFHYESRELPATESFPVIDAPLVSLHDLECFDWVFKVRAVPVHPVMFHFEGRVDTVFDGLDALGDVVDEGETFRGSFTFDPSTPNTAPPVADGEAGLYHHDEPPAGVRLRVGPLVFATRSAARRTRTLDTVPSDLDFDVIVNDDVGPDGADEYGFSSPNAKARGLRPDAPVDRIDIDWLASTITTEPLDSADLPLMPPSLDLLGGGLLRIEGECTVCSGPAAFFRIEGRLTSLTIRPTVERSIGRFGGGARARGK